MVKATQRRRRNRRLPSRNQPPPPLVITVTSVQVTTPDTNVILHFNAPVTLGVPAGLSPWSFTNDADHISAIVSGNGSADIVVTIGATVTAGDPYSMPQLPTSAASGTTGIPIAGKVGAVIA
jgi:hypothetical protein